MKKYLIIFILLFASIIYGQTFVTIPDKVPNDQLTSAEFNTILDAIKDGTLSIQSATSKLDSIYAKTDTIYIVSPIKFLGGLFGIGPITNDSVTTDVLVLTNKDYGDITANGVSWTIDADVIDTTNIVDAGFYTYIAARVRSYVNSMVTGNTETGIAVTFQPSDNTVDFVVSESDPTVDTDDEIIAIINASPSTQIGVPGGGTGAGTFTANGAIYGNTTSAFQVTAAHTANGSLLIGDGSGVPTVATITAGNGITVTNGAGSITITRTATNFNEFSAQCDSSRLSANDTLGCEYAHQAFTVDSVLVITYGPTPNMTFQIVHGSTNLFSGAQTKNALGTTAYTSFADATIDPQSDIYIIWLSVTTKPKTAKVIIIGHYTNV